MNVQKYKELLRLRQSEEYFLFQMIYFKSKEVTVRDIINITRIPHKRAWYILDKWCRKGWYSYGVTLDLGWLTVKQMPLNFAEHKEDEDEKI